MSLGIAAAGVWVIAIGVVLLATARRLTRLFFGRSVTRGGAQDRAFVLALRLLGVFAIWFCVCVLAAGLWPAQEAWLIAIGVVGGSGIFILVAINFAKAARASKPSQHP